MRKIVVMAGMWWVVVGMSLAAPAALVVQQVGVLDESPSELQSMGNFLAQAVLGYSDRKQLRLVSAREEDLRLLRVDRLSSVVTLSLRREGGERILVDLRFVDSEGTNVVTSFTQFSASSWMKELPEVAVRVYREISRRYPPRPLTEVKTVTVVKKYSPYEVVGHEVSLGMSVGYVGVTRHGEIKVTNAPSERLRGSEVGVAGDLLVLWRHGPWYGEGQIHGFLVDEPVVAADGLLGYGLFGGVISLQLGGVFVYEKHDWYFQTDPSEQQQSSTHLSFSLVRGFPLMGIRIAFQPFFWVNMVAGGPLPGVPHVIWEEGLSASLPWSAGFVRVQAYLRYGAHGLFFLSWRTMSIGAGWDTDGVRLSDTKILKGADETWGSVSLGGAYVF